MTDTVDKVDYWTTSEFGQFDFARDRQFQKVFQQLWAASGGGFEFLDQSLRVIEAQHRSAGN